MATVKQVVFTSLGDALEVSKVIDIPLQPVQNNQVSVRVKYSPINPADFLRTKGQLAPVNTFPSALGGEGVGIVEQVGKDCSGIHVGDVVLLPNGICWTERLVCYPEELTILPKDIDLRQASMLSINPATAYLLINNLKPGDWLIQNAANSQVGKLIIKFASLRKINTINIVRREDVTYELRYLGANAVIVGENDLAKRVLEETQGAPISLALDCIGGKSTGKLAECLSPGGKLIVYGVLSGEPLELPSAKVTFGDITISGFSRLRAMKNMGRENANKLLLELAQMVKDGKLSSSIERVFKLSELKEALTLAKKDGREGKVLLEMNH